jgi:hypothetical protein
LSHAPFLRASTSTVELAVRVTPKARRAAIGGTLTDARGVTWLRIDVTEPADRGRATRAAMRLVADRCGVAASEVTLLSGAASRWKRLGVAGDPATIASRLADATTG